MGKSKNTRLKKAGTQTTYTLEQIQELKRCMTDPVYFIENYVYIRGKDGKAKFKMYDYQKDIVRSYQDNTRIVVLASRQVGKCCASATNINICKYKSKFKEFLYKTYTKIERWINGINL